MLSQLITVIFGIFGSYYIAKYTIASTGLGCNRHIQSFDLYDRTVYWKVQSGSCNKQDPNFEHLRTQLEKMLTENYPDWEESLCSYSTLGNSKYVFSYGTDYYKVDELDCIKPLKDLEREYENRNQ